MFGFFPFAAGAFADLGTSPVSVSVEVVGVQAVGRVNKILLWSPVIDTQYPDWQNIPDGQTPAWALVNDSQTPGWALVDDTQVSGWTPVDDNPATNWTQIPT